MKKADTGRLFLINNDYFDKLNKLLLMNHKLNISLMSKLYMLLHYLLDNYL